jgi:hypothetical protein
MSVFVEARLPDDLIVQVLSFLSAPQELSRVESVNQQFHSLPTDLLWRNECVRTWPLHYCCEEEDEADATSTTPTRDDVWKRRYRLIQQDLQRTELTSSQLEGLEWTFHFVNHNNNNPNNNQTIPSDYYSRRSNNNNNVEFGALPPQSSSSPCYFLDGRLYILDYLWRFALLEIELLEYGDDDENGENEQGQLISNLLWENRQSPYLPRALSAAAAAAAASTSSEDVPSSSNNKNNTCLDPSSQTSSRLRFSYRQSLRIADFALHSVARTVPDGGWMVWNKHVVLASTGTKRRGPLPGILQDHLAFLRHFDS